MRRRFSWKPFTSFFVLLSFTCILLSGLVLYVAPPGRIANWTHWRLGPLDKAQWQALHTVFALMFATGAALHLIFNWRVLLAYLKTRIHTGSSHRRELAVASVLTAAVLALTLAEAPPFSSVMALGETAKNSWAGPDTEPPVAHAEGLSIAKLADVTKQPVDQVVAELEKSGVRGVAADKTVGELAAANRMTPQQLYVRTRDKDKTPPVPVNVETGLGRKTVEQVCRELGLDVRQGLARLEQAGLQAQAGSTMKEVATAHGRTPHDVLPVIRGS